MRRKFGSVFFSRRSCKTGLDQECVWFISTSVDISYIVHVDAERCFYPNVINKKTNNRNSRIKNAIANSIQHWRSIGNLRVCLKEPKKRSDSRAVESKWNYIRWKLSPWSGYIFLVIFFCKKLKRKKILDKTTSFWEIRIGVSSEAITYTKKVGYPIRKKKIGIDM